MIVLFICSGNTCRSPLAAAILSDRLSREPGLDDIKVISAGTAAWDGTPASEGSYLVALERGLDLSAHRARALTRQTVRDADLVLAMSATQARRAVELGGEGKVMTLPDYVGNPDGVQEVPDPMGEDVAAYRSTADLLGALIDDLVVRLKAERRR